MNVGTLWEHRVQIAGECRPAVCWPTFYKLSYAEDFIRELTKAGVKVVAIHSVPIRIINAPGGTS